MIKGSIHWEHRTEDMILLGRHGYKEAKYNSKTVSAKSKHATPQANNSSPGYTPKRKEYICPPSVAKTNVQTFKAA